MRGLTYLVAGILLLMMACQQKIDSPKQETKAPVALSEKEVKPVNPLLTEYELFLAKLDSGEVTSVSKAADKYVSLFKGQLTSVADSGFVLFNRFYHRSDNILNERHDIGKYDSLLISHNLPLSLNQSREIMDYEKLLRGNGFKLAMSEGITYLQQDLDFIAKHFYPFISPVLKEYLTRLNKENKEGFSEDAGITIGATQLADRVIWREDFIENNPNFILLKDADEERRSYLGTLLMGMDNSPVLSFEDDKLDKYYAVAYRHLDMKAPTSQANKLVRPVHQALQKGDTAQANSLVKKYLQAGLLY